MNEDWKLWLEEAKWDLDNAKILYKKKRHNTVVFHSQQASEKAVKALLCVINLNGWGHSIFKLLQKYAESMDKKIDQIQKKALFLDKHYITTRYPDVLPGIAPHKAFNKNEAKSSIDKAIDIINFVEEEIESVLRREEKNIED